MTEAAKVSPGLPKPAHVLMARLPKFRLDPRRPPTFHCGHVVGADSLHLLGDV